MPSVEPIRDVQTYGAAVAQSTREEILQGKAEFAEAAIDELKILEKVGIYGAATATFGLYKGGHVISEEGSACDGTSFGADWSKVPDVNIVLRPGEKLKCYMTDSAADPAGLVFAVKGQVVKFR